jgi:uncharacterized alpha-E superfamily protein
MLSRVADALYWLGRYVERSEHIARLLLVTEDFSSETQGLAEDLAQTAWKDLLAVFPSAQLTRPVSAFAPLSLPYLQAFFLDGGNAYSILFSMRKARENARAVREALSLEVWLAINEAYRALEAYERKAPADLPGLRDALTATHKGLFAIVGALESTLTRDEGWRFLKLGEALERTHRTAQILRAKLPALLAPEGRADRPLAAAQWRSLLRALASLESYRRLRGARLEPALIVPFLLFDAQSPRSLHAATATVQHALELIGEPGALSPAGRLIGRLAADLRYNDDAIVSTGGWAPLLDRVVDVTGRTHEALAAQYFVT